MLSIQTQALSPGLDLALSTDRMTFTLIIVFSNAIVFRIHFFKKKKSKENIKKEKRRKKSDLNH